MEARSEPVAVASCELYDERAEPASDVTDDTSEEREDETDESADEADEAEDREELREEVSVEVAAVEVTVRVWACPGVSGVGVEGKGGDVPRRWWRRPGGRWSGVW